MLFSLKQVSNLSISLTLFYLLNDNKNIEGSLSYRIRLCVAVIWLYINKPKLT